MSKKEKSKDKVEKLKSKHGVPVDDYLDKINEILYSFNFKKVRLVMKALNWKWSTASLDGAEIPSIERMQATARHLLTHVATTRDVVCATGGFYAHRYGNGVLELSFIVENYETDPF